MENVNYQLMEQSADGKYYPDYAKLIAKASCADEAAYIKEVASHNFGFAFNMVYVTKQVCGHFEIFQTPQNEYHPMVEKLEEAVENATTRKCTGCICGWRKK